MKQKLKKTGMFLLGSALVLVSAIAVGAKTYASNNPNHFTTITLHAGEMGYFDGNPETKEKESVQRKGDTFKEDTAIPTHDKNGGLVGRLRQMRSIPISIMG